MTDQEIIILFTQGKREKAFTKLYGEWPKTRRLVKQLGGNTHDARDIFHDALYVLFNKLETRQFTLTGSLNGFIYQTARNLCLEKLRKENRLRGTTQDIPDQPDTDDHAAHDEQLNMAERALEKLAEKCREILRLFYWEKRPMQYIAQKVGLKSEQAAKTQKYKCLEAARNEFHTLEGKEAVL